MSAEAGELRALRKVSQGGVTIHNGGYAHAGCPIGGELGEALVRLHIAGHLTIGPPAPDRHRPVQLTVAGTIRLAELSQGSHHG